MQNKDKIHGLTATEILDLHKNRSLYVALARSYLNDIEQAEDVFGESLLFMLENINKLQIINAKWYFSRIILNKCLYILRQQQNHNRIKNDIKISTIISENIDILSEKSSERMIFNADLIQMFSECRCKMTDKTYNIFIDAKLNGLSHKELAKIYKVTGRNITYEIQRATEIFRRVFRDYLLPMVLIVTYYFITTLPILRGIDTIIS